MITVDNRTGVPLGSDALEGLLEGLPIALGGEKNAALDDRRRFCESGAASSPSSARIDGWNERSHSSSGIAMPTCASPGFFEPPGGSVHIVTIARAALPGFTPRPSNSIALRSYCPGLYPATTLEA